MAGTHLVTLLVGYVGRTDGGSGGRLGCVGGGDGGVVLVDHVVGVLVAALADDVRQRDRGAGLVRKLKSG